MKVGDWGIFPNSFHSDLLQQNTQLTVPILDALSSLSLSSSLLSEVPTSLLQTHVHVFV